MSAAAAVTVQHRVKKYGRPAQIGDPLRTIMYYSPSGAAVKAVLDSAFNGSLSYPALLTMAVYTVIFGFTAIRYFRWE